MVPEGDDQRLLLVQQKAEEWARKLIDLSPRNTLLHFKNTKTATLDLTQTEPEALRGLLDGRPTRLEALFKETAAHKEACLRARNLRRRIAAFDEEQGIDVGKLAFGLVLTAPPKVKGTASVPALRAPLLLRSVSIEPRTIAQNDFVLQLGDDTEVNPVLLHGLDQKYGLDLDIDTFSAMAETALADAATPDEQVKRVFGELVDIAARQEMSMSLEDTATIGLFSYEKLPMVNDLRAATELLAGHDLIASLAGYQPATLSVQADLLDFSPPEPDAIEPADEFLVQDADSSQQRAIVTALAGHHVLIEGPPGTGKSQTIANIIAGAAAQGKRVLFVAEKRAAIEAVTDRLAKAGLDGLVFDLHQQKVDKKQVAKQLQQSLETAGRQLPVNVDELHRRLVQRRRTVRGYSTELHLLRAPWGVSAFDLQNELLALAAFETRHRFRGSMLRALDEETVRGLEQALREFVELGGSRVLLQESPWWRASIRDEHDIEKVLVQLDELTGRTLREGQNGMHALLRQTGLPVPRDLAGWQQVLELLDGVHQSVQGFGQDVFGTQLDEWCCATAGRSDRKRYPMQLSWSRRRAVVKQIKAASTDGLTKKPALHAKLREVAAQRERWRQLGGMQVQPAEILGLRRTMNTFHTLRNQLTAVAMCAQLQNVETQPTEQVDRTLNELSADRVTLFRMPKITSLLDNFQRLGLSDLLNEAARRGADGEQAWLLFRNAWLNSLLDEFKLRVPALREFVGEQQTRLVGEFQDADVEHRERSADRVRWMVAKRLRQARDDYPDETKTLRDQASKKSRHMPIRRLVEKTSNVLLALRPCWAMSPLVVSKTLPAEQLFDLVIFDEASQIEPHDAITSIVRGRRLVVAGDDKQLPPTNFFASMLDGLDDNEDDDENQSLTDYESILMAVRPVLPESAQTMLKWHYRSRDERLIAFSNREIYGDQLVTFPGAFRETPVTLEVVDGVASPGQDGSAPDEIRRVVELVLEHAEQRPQESLGVITMGQKHLDRVDSALRRAIQERPDLQDFFTEKCEPGRRFFVKNLERVQGDERDAIILTVGVAKRANGAVARTGFGPLNSKSGQRRLNVAVTRAKRRMTVVSSFGYQDLAPSEEVTGTELLRRYLEFAHHGGQIENVGRLGFEELNGFESDVSRALADRGIPVHPQWGFAEYRIDFALAHPGQPGRMVLAVEADGDTYHRSYSTRDRDRLRQSHLENLGWRFHRVWSSAWFADREGETDRIVKAWERAVVDADREPEPEVPHNSFVSPLPEVTVTRGPRPNVPPGLRIQDYSDGQLIGLCRWLMTDKLQLDREERLEQARNELGFKRRGSRIVERLTRAVEIAQHQIDQEGY
jgi:very-short-patch-repair endonuclease